MGAPGPLCGERVGADWIDAGTLCRSKSSPSGPIGLNHDQAAVDIAESPSVIEVLRQQAIIGSILGIRQAIATMANMVGNPMAIQTWQKDQMFADQLLAQGNYQRAFEVATGFADYFDIHKEGKTIGSSKGETVAVMLGHATGFNQAVSVVKGETRSGTELRGIDRFSTGLEALLRIASTTLTVAGSVQGLGLGSTIKVVSPVYRIAGRDIVIVETSMGRQAFYRSSGANSGSPGQWLPVDEFRPADGWFNKAAYTQGPGLEKGSPLHRFGTEEFAQMSKKLGEMSIPKGYPVPAGKMEIEEMTLNRILDFFEARKTPTTQVRPVPEK
jgi:hypothetical protein